jgi:hypothetical protein
MYCLGLNVIFQGQLFLSASYEKNPVVKNPVINSHHFLLSQTTNMRQTTLFRSNRIQIGKISAIWGAPAINWFRHPIIILLVGESIPTIMVNSG